jgi:hypothetical protein
MSYLAIAKKAEEKLKGEKVEAAPFPEVVEDKTILAVAPCWNCGAAMTETRDIYGKEWWACWGCAVTV